MSDNGSVESSTADIPTEKLDTPLKNTVDSARKEQASEQTTNVQQNSREVFVICECGRRVTFPQAAIPSTTTAAQPVLESSTSSGTDLPKSGDIANIPSDHGQLGVGSVQSNAIVPLDTLSSILQNTNGSFNKNVDPGASKDPIVANSLAIQGLSYAIMAQSASETASQLVNSLLEGITAASPLSISGGTEASSQPQSTDKVSTIGFNSLFSRGSTPANFSSLSAKPDLVAGSTVPVDTVGIDAVSTRGLGSLVRSEGADSESQQHYPSISSEGLPRTFEAHIPPPGRMLFYTFDELKEYCYKHAKEHGYELSIGASRRMTPKKRQANSQDNSDVEGGSSSDTVHGSGQLLDSRDDFRYVYFNCSRRGKEAPKDLKRKSRPKGTGCEFKLYANRYGSLWRLTVKHAEHNHPPNFDPHTLYVARRLPPEYREDFNMLMRQNFKPKEILELLKTMHGDKSCFTIKSIYEEVKRYKSQFATSPGTTSDAQ